MDNIVVSYNQQEAQVLAELYAMIIRSGGLGVKEAQLGIQKISDAANKAREAQAQTAQNGARRRPPRDDEPSANIDG